MNTEGRVIERRQRGRSALVFAAAKAVALGLAVALLLVQFSGGSRASRASFETMSNEVINAADLSNMQLADNQMIRRLYGLDPAAYEGVLLYYPVTNMGAEELLLVKLADAGQRDSVREAVEGRLATQLTSFEGYGAEQTAMLQNSVVEARNSYVLFCSAADPAPVRRAFLRAY